MGRKNVNKRGVENMTEMEGIGERGKLERKSKGRLDGMKKKIDYARREL